MKMLSKQDINQIKKVINQALNCQEKKLDKKFTVIDKRFDGIDEKFTVIDKRFDGIEKEIIAQEKRLKAVIKKEIRGLVLDIGELLDERILPQITNHEKRITALEQTSASII